MKELHWFPLYSADWLGSQAVSRMLPEQEGAFLRLLLIAWGEGEQEPSLPTDGASLANMSRLGARWRKLGPLVREQFVERDGRLYNARLSEIWTEQQQKHADAVKKAKKAVDAREAKRATKRSTGDRGDNPEDQRRDHLGNHLGDIPGLSNSESEGAVESATARSLPAPAPDGALALEGRAPGAERVEQPGRAAPPEGWLDDLATQLKPGTRRVDDGSSSAAESAPAPDVAAAEAWLADHPAEQTAVDDALRTFGDGPSDRGRARLRRSVLLARWRLAGAPVPTASHPSP